MPIGSSTNLIDSDDFITLLGTCRFSVGSPRTRTYIHRCDLSGPPLSTLEAMRLAVTGCHGAVGKRVTLLALRRGHTVRGIDHTARKDEDEDARYIYDHPQFSFIETDLREYDNSLNALKDSDAVIQLAALPNPTDKVAITHNTYIYPSDSMIVPLRKHDLGMLLFPGTSFAHVPR
jgi:hypothetical protein